LSIERVKERAMASLRESNDPVALRLVRPVSETYSRALFDRSGRGGERPRQGLGSYNNETKTEKQQLGRHRAAYFFVVRKRSQGAQLRWTGNLASPS
jgi:hypothetical protein